MEGVRELPLPLPLPDRRWLPEWFNEHVPPLVLHAGEKIDDWLRGWFDEDVPTVALHAREKTGDWALDWVRAQPDVGAAEPGKELDFEKHIEASFNGSDVDIFSWPQQDSSHVEKQEAAVQLRLAERQEEAAQHRRVEKNQEEVVQLRFPGLAAGDYAFPLRFTASNSKADDAQRLTVKVHVRENLAIAVLCLMAGSVVSYLATQVAAAFRRRAKLVQSLQEMGPRRLADEAETLPEAALRVELALNNELSRHGYWFWPSAEAALDARIDEARKLNLVVDQLRSAREQIRREIPESYVREMANWVVDRITAGIGAKPLSDADFAALKARLENGLGTAQAETYATELTHRIDALLATVKIGQLTAAAQPVANSLRDRLKQALTKDLTKLRLHENAETDNIYRRLKILCESKVDPRLTNKLIRSDIENWRRTGAVLGKTANMRLTR